MAERIANLSPIFADSSDPPPTIIAVGEDETDEFIRQTEVYTEQLKGSDNSCEHLILKGKNHYTVSRMLSSNNNPLISKILALGASG